MRGYPPRRPAISTPPSTTNSSPTPSARGWQYPGPDAQSLVCHEQTFSSVRPPPVNLQRHGNMPLQDFLCTPPPPPPALRTTSGTSNKVCRASNVVRLLGGSAGVLSLGTRTPATRTPPPPRTPPQSQ